MFLTNKKTYMVLLASILLFLFASIQVEGAPACVGCLDVCFSTAAVCMGLGPLGSTACFLFCEGVCLSVCAVAFCFGSESTFVIQK